MSKRHLLHNADDTIAAISTPQGEGGIGIVRLSGKKALSIADKIFVSKNKTKPSKCKAYTVHYGHIVKGLPPPGCLSKPLYSSPGVEDSPGVEGLSRNNIIDEVLLTVMRAPRSYTKEDIVEINCHGGIVPLRKALDLVLSLGVRLAQPGEFTKRAFLNGRIDLTQAEGVLDIIKAKTDSSMKVAVGHLEGELSGTIRGLRTKILNILSDVEAQIDFSEEEIPLSPKDEMSQKLSGISMEIKNLIDNTWKGMIFKEGILCVISGKPNVGKSSLMNILLRRNRVIVSPIPGTTRDAIEEEINLNGVPLRVVDTAGISRAKDIVEKHGIRKSKSYIKMADLVLFMLDLSKPWSKGDKEIFNAIKGKKLIVVANKSDLKRSLDIRKVEEFTGKGSAMEISLRKKKGLEKLEKAISEKIWHGEIMHPEGAFVSNLRHKHELKLAHRNLKHAKSALGKESFLPEIVASSLREAVFSLGSILGETVEPDILNRIFSKFCIGK